MTAFLCDHSNDCGDDGDESFCTCGQKYQKYFACNNSQKCSPLYFMDNTGTCTIYQNHSGTRSEKSKGPTYGKLAAQTGDLCEGKNQLPCTFTHSVYFSFHDICVYRLDAQSHLVPCKSGSNLQQCQSFQCSNKFKCPYSYCVPWGFVCNGRWDCPDENAENICATNRICDTQLQCIKSHICVSVYDLCDGQTDCPMGDDELLCEILSTKCPPSCDCLNLAILCKNVALGNKLIVRSQPYIAYHLE